MLPLSLDDLLPLDEFAGKRREFFESHCRYLDRYRRVRVGPQATLLFENRQTLWFRVQEVLRIARINDPHAMQLELDLFNRLLPQPGQVQASLIIEVKDQAQVTAELVAWTQLAGDHVKLHVGKQAFPSCLVTCRPEDRCFGAAHWLQFDLEEAGRKLLADFRLPASLEIDVPTYHYHSPPFSEDIRQSLVDDLKESTKALRAVA